MLVAIATPALQVRNDGLGVGWLRTHSKSARFKVGWPRSCWLVLDCFAALAKTGLGLVGLDPHARKDRIGLS